MNLLRWGYNRGLPEGVTTAWGCRAIVDLHGIDVVWDRTDLAGEDGVVGRERKDLLAGYLDALPTEGGWRDRAWEMIKSGRLQTRSHTEATLYQDDKVVIKGNCNASHGYLYVCAYLAEDAQNGHAPSAR